MAGDLTRRYADAIAARSTLVVVGFLVLTAAVAAGAVGATDIDTDALCWLLGAMALFGIPFNSETAVITSLAIGLGVDYSIHATERFVEEREHSDSLPGAMEATITGTGGALLASAATTAGGFGVLGFALAPPIRRFGLVTGVSIVFALVACLMVLPCLLVLRERLLDRRGSDT